MPKPEPAHCRSCGAEILWVVMRWSRKRNPLDADPVPGGNIVVRNYGRGVSEALADWYAEVLGKDEQDLADEDRYVSHFATCPDREEWRKR